MSILVLDNYDSFTYNLVHILRRIASEPVDVFRNDEIGPEEAKRYGRIVLSPGPGIPDEAGNLKAVIAACQDRPTLGVCLGHQAIAEVMGGKLVNLSKVYHGVATRVLVSEERDPLFEGLGDTFEVGRYHSWSVRRDSLPDCLKITAIDAQGEIMALAHKELPIKGVQFHPESVLTPVGEAMLGNWLRATA